ncbi:chromate transporter family protein [Clostridium argentinense CDC 2741]|uniref:Chromate transporter family protein n=2 Tax=Clostridium argentinense TaxID=29341 RepID=A0A0C1U5A3_9CLOT|nr:chromate transporter family protein [Clostridium argentinense CDC 2741]
MVESGDFMKEKELSLKEKLQMFFTFFKIGIFTFGGGYSMIPLIEKEVVNKNKWLTKKEISDLLSLSQTLPGSVTINSATLIGYKILQLEGSIIATLGVVLPSFIIILIISLFFTNVAQLGSIQAFLHGVQSAIISLILFSAISLKKESIEDKLNWIILIISLISMILFHINPIIIIFIGIIIGSFSFAIKH